MISTIPLFDKTKASTRIKFIRSEDNCSFLTCFLLFTNCFYLNVVSLKTINHTTIGHYCIGRKLVYETFQYILWAVFCFLPQTKTSTRMKFIRSEDNCSFQTSFLHTNCFYIGVLLLKNINYTTIGYIALAISWCRNFSIHHKSCFFSSKTRHDINNSSLWQDKGINKDEIYWFRIQLFFPNLLFIVYQLFLF
jgi:hypothetical protein